MELYSTNFMSVYYDEKNSLISNKWTKATSKLTEETFKKEVLRHLENVEKLHPNKLLIDTSDFEFVIMPEIHDWHGETISPKYVEAGVKKIAFIVPEELFSQTSIEQTMEEEKDEVLETEYFDSETEALKWL